MTSNYPSEEERELVRKYVMERPLVRPSITYKRASLTAFVFLLIAGGGSVLISLLGFFLFRKNDFRFLFGMSEKSFWILISVFIFLIAVFFVRKKAAVGMIHLYQHYAPEEMRRRCLLKPTCSEYAILAIKKYGIIIGCIKIWNRLNYKCRGSVYYIDELK